MSLTTLLNPSVIRLGYDVRDKEDAIMAMTELLMGKAGVLNLGAVQQAVLAREELMSTGVGQGLAIPHAKTNAVEQVFAAFATLAEPIPFDAIDDQPVRIIFLLIAPESAAKEHLQLLGTLSRLMSKASFRYNLLDAGSPEEVMELFAQAEQNLKG